MEYFNLYEKYYEKLNGNESIVGKANDLVTLCENSLRQINSAYFDKISESKWEELGKEVVQNNILFNLKSNITKTVDFININLKGACDLSINSLLPKVIEIKKEDETLQGLRNELITLNGTRSTIVGALASTRQYNIDKNGNKTINSRWSLLKGQLDSINGKIGRLQTDIGNQIVKLKTLCEEANSIISSILELDGSLSFNKANLPDYNSIPIPDYALIEDLSDELGEPFTFDKISNDPNFPFTIVNDSYRETGDGGYRFEFKYINNGVTEIGFILIPKTVDKKYDNLFAFYSGSGGLNWIRLNQAFHGIKANPDFPVIAFGRAGDPEYRSLEEMNTTLEAVKDFKSYFGTSGAKAHLIANSRGGQDGNIIVAQNPNFFASATIINGSIKFDANEVGGSSNDNWIQRLYGCTVDEAKKKCEKLISNYENAQTKINIFIGTADGNIKPKEQLEDYCEIVNMTTDYHYLPLQPIVNNYVYDEDGRMTGKYNPIWFDELDKVTPNATELIFPKSITSISDYFNGETSKQVADANGKMDLYFIDGGEHAGSTLSELLGHREFYDLIINTSK